MTFKAIGKRVGKDQTTISKEVRKHLEYTPTKTVYRDKSGNETPTPVCPRLLKTPFVCNPCDKKRYACPYQKQKYVAKTAQREYETLLVEAREGIPLNKESFYEADRIISEGIQDGQHLYHILQSNDLKMSKSAVYRNLHKGYLSVSAVDFPRVVKFKPRKTKPVEYIPRGLKIGRTKLFFCDPYQSSQKPRVEKNHTLFRDIVPKGQSFDSFTQDTVNLIFSHVNSVKRKSLNGKTPYEMFTFAYSVNITELLGITQIPAKQVVQSSLLLKGKKS